MKLKHLSFALAMMLVLSSCGQKKEEPDIIDENPEETEQPEPIPAELSAASFNIRVDTASDTGEKDWSARKANVASVIKKYDFDVFGLQEVLYKQRDDLKKLLPEYGFHMVGRDSGNSGEEVGVVYKTSVLEIEDWGYFWLSDTPDVPSNSLCWGGMERKRVAAWTLLRHKESGKKFYFVATHLEVNNSGVSYANVREKSAELIVKRMAEINADRLPLFVVGDMNPGVKDDPALVVFRKYYQDAYGVAEEKGTRKGPKATYQAFDTTRDLDKANSYPHDYIFCTDGVVIDSYEAITDTFGGNYPSDHLPVMAGVRF